MECNGSWLVYFPLIGIPRARWYMRRAELECWCIKVWMINRGWPLGVDNDGPTTRPSVLNIKTVFATTVMGKWSRVGFTLRLQTQTTSPETQTAVSGHCLQNFPCKYTKKCKEKMQVQSTIMKGKFKVQIRDANVESKERVEIQNGISKCQYF